MKTRKFLLIIAAFCCLFTFSIFTACGDKEEVIPVKVTVAGGFSSTFDISKADETVMTLEDGSALPGSATYGGWLIKNGEEFAATVHVQPFYVNEKNGTPDKYGFLVESDTKEMQIIIRHLDSAYDSENITLTVNGTKVTRTSNETSDTPQTGNSANVWRVIWFYYQLPQDLSEIETFDIQIGGLTKKA